MKKVLVLVKDRNLNYKLVNVIDKTQYTIISYDVALVDAYSFIYKNEFDTIVVDSSYLNGYYQLFDKLIYLKKWIIVYISNRMEYGLLYNVINSPRFYILNENRIEGINDVIQIMNKDSKTIELLDDKVTHLKEKAEEDLLVRKAKALLMSKKGLSEDDAYHMILKKSMDNRQSKGAISKSIIEELT